MNSLRKSLLALAAVAVLAVGCGGESVELVTADLAPAGSDAAMVSNTLPAVMAPGERRVVTVTVQNTGTIPGTNDWPAGASYVLKRMSASPLWGISSFNTPTATSVGAQVTFSFTIAAPSTPGTYPLTLQMYSTISGQTGSFGAALTTNIVVDAGETPFYACSYEAASSTVPATMFPDTNQVVTVVVRNTGSQTWTAGDFRIYSRNSPLTLWNFVSQNLAAPVAPGATASFTFTIRSPSTAATYPFVFDMHQNPGIGFFGADCLNTSISVGGTAALANVLGADTYPSVLAPSEPRSVSISFQNTGTETWTSGTAFAISSLSTPPNLFGTTIAYLNSTVAPTQTATFTFPINAPATPGTYTASYRMRKLSGTGAGFFGATFTRSVVVDGSATPQLNAAAVSNTFPTLMTASTTTTVTLTVNNNGTSAWSGSGFSLRSVSTPSYLFGTVDVPLGSSETVAAGANKTFSFNITAPATAGMYTSSWRMRSSTAGLFGATINVPVTVTLCGNGTIDAGETCDDGNLVSGDGCSSTCQADPTVVVDLAAGNAGRALTGGGTAPVTIGDVTNDGVPDVIVQRNNPPTGVPRALCGTVYGFVGGPGFFTNTTDALPSSAGFAIVGAETRDQLGIISSGNIITGDVTGDGVADLIVGAPNADGPSNARADAGEVYVIKGSPALATAGTIDLGAMTPSPHLATTIYGALGGDLLAPLAVGDVSGDGFNDLVLGAPQYGTGGSTIGRVQIILGSASGITGTIDLAAPVGFTVVTISGTAANDRVGTLAALGNFSGSATTDLLITGRSTNNTNNDGAVWGFVGPITADRTIGLGAGGADIGWIGAAANDRLGSSLAVGDVRGTTSADVLIGMTQYQRSAGVQSGGVAVFDGPVAPGLYDLSASMANVDALIVGDDQFDDFGVALTTGDVNGDGRADVIVGARAADGPTDSAPSTGEVVVVLGGTTLTGTIDLDVANSAAMIIYGVAGGDLFGSYRNTLTAGDVDGDGQADVCSSSHRNSAGAGRVDCVLSPF